MIPHSHPWRALAANVRFHLLRRTAIVAVGLTFLMQKMGRPLKSMEAPLGIVSLELAGSGAKVDRILTEWSPLQEWAAWRGLMLDFAYLLAYGIALSLACALVAESFRERRPRLARLAEIASWGSLAAAALDVIENVALMLELRGGDPTVLAPLAFVAAVAKFALVALALITIVVAAVLRLSSARMAGTP